MKRNKSFFSLFCTLVLSLLVSVSSSFSLSSFAASSSEGGEIITETVGVFSEDSYASGYSYEGQEVFDPIDVRPIRDCSTLRVSELADETYRYSDSTIYGNSDPDELRAQYEAVATKILAGVRSEWSDLRKIIYIHDYICDHTDYWDGDYDLIAYSAYGCLVLNKAVCDGYARAFYDLANRAGVETYYILSYDNNVESADALNHCWNASKIDGRFYYIDVTWDGSYENTRHFYFLKSESFFRNNGHECPTFCQVAYINGGYNKNLNGLYNHKNLDNALWNDCEKSLDMVGDTDEFLFYKYDNGVCHFGTADRNRIIRDYKLTYEDNTWDGGQQIYDYRLVGDKLFIDRNCMWVYYGVPDNTNNTLDFKLLLKAKDTEYIRGFKIEGEKLYYDTILQTEWNLNPKMEYDQSIDIGKILYDEFYSNGLPDKSGSKSHIEGLNLKWNYSNGKYYWYENSVKQGTYDDPLGIWGDGSVRGREICDNSVLDSFGNGTWYWLDSVYDGAKAIDKEVWIPYIFQEEGTFNEESILEVASSCDGGMEGVGKNVYEAIKNKTGKWVRYDSEGKMCKGWLTIDGAYAYIYPEQAGNTYYYDSVTGLMAKGFVLIDGIYYHFDENTGVLKN